MLSLFLVKMAFGTFNDELANAGGPAQNIGGHTLDITRV